MRPLVASLILLAGCAHTPGGAGGSPASAPPAGAAPAAPAAPAAVDPFAGVRDAAEALLSAQGEAAWRGWTGGEPADPAAAWKGREALLDPALIGRLGEAAAAAAPPERGRLERLRAFLLGEQLARATDGPSRALAAARAAASFGWEKRTLPLRQLPSLLAGEPEAPRRKAAAEAWRAEALKLEKPAAARDAALLRAGAARGLGSWRALAGALRLEEPARLAALAESTLAAGDATWPATLDALGRQELGIPGPRLGEQDLPRLLRTTAAPGAFPAERLLPEVEALLSGLGLELAAGGRIGVDAAPRPGKLSRPLAVPVEVPGQVRLSLVPLAGLDALRALLHEVGIALSLAHVSADAPLEDRRLAPAWQTEAWGLLFEEIAADPEWLVAHGLSPEAAGREARVAAGRRLRGTRAAAATVLIEVARAQDPAGAVAAWAALAPRLLGHAPERGQLPPWRLDADPLLRAADTLRAELLAGRLSGWLAALAGERRWWRAPAAGAWLRQAWSKGGGWEAEPPSPPQPPSSTPPPRSG